MKTKGIVVWAIVAAASAALIAWFLQPEQIPVETATVSRGTFERTVDEQAKTRVRDPYTVSTPLAGVLDRVALVEGDLVKQGQIVATLHPAEPALLDARTRTELAARLEAARASKKRAEVVVAATDVALAQAAADLERTEKLARDSLVAQSKLETDRLMLALRRQESQAARAAVHVAGHDVEVARAALSRTAGGRSMGAAAWALRSPIDGRVVKVFQKSEATLPVGAPVLELADSQDLEIVVELLTNEAAQLAPGAEVRLSNWGGEADLRGRLRRIEPRAFTKISTLGVEEQRVNAIIDIVSPPAEWGALGEGFRVDARIVAYRRENVLRVPSAALFRVGDRWQVFEVDEHNTARARSVTLGQRSGSEAELLGGIAAGARVVIYPSDSVADGVGVAPSATAPASGS